MSPIHSIRLEAKSASAGGKFYEIEINQAASLSSLGTRSYTVDFRYGAIGGNTRNGTKTKTPVPLDAARKIYDALIDEKIHSDSHYQAVAQSAPGYKIGFTCPTCGKTNYNANDLTNSYCGACHEFQQPASVPKPFVYPTHCFSCKVYLMGGATKHTAECELVLNGLVPGADGNRRPTEAEIDKLADKFSKFSATSPVCLPPRLLKDIDPADVQRLVNDEAWWVEIKHDGDRVQLHLRDGLCVLYSARSGRLRVCPPKVAAALAGTVGHVVFDGELVGDTLFLFDMLMLADQDIQALPYYSRYVNCQVLVEAVGSPVFQMVYAARTTEAKAALILAAKQNGNEGVVFVRAVAPYTPGRNDDSLRWKFRASASVVVMAHHPVKVSMTVGIYNPATGSVYRIGTVTMIGKGEMPPVGAVVEVEYLYCQSALVQTGFKRQLYDVARETCTRDQLQFKDGKDPQASHA